jgi:tRNA dimethylallyltransferase
MNSLKHSLMLLVGPTAVGKTELSLRTAKRLRGEIVSADSRQVYRYMDIGTAKPSPEQRTQVRHHFIDVIDPDEYFSAGEYGRQGRGVIHEVFHRGSVPLVVGGSGLYIRALVDGFFDPVVFDARVRKNLRGRMKKFGPEALHAELKKIDQGTAVRIHPHDSQRIVRALEVYEITGRPLSSLRKESTEDTTFEPLFIGLTRPRPELYERIDRRVEGMIEAGLVDEVKRLSARGYGRTLNSMQTVGYLDGEFHLEEAVRRIKRNSRHYAKRQLTWFRQDRRIQWYEIHREEEMDPIIERIIGIYEHKKDKA